MAFSGTIRRPGPDLRSIEAGVAIWLARYSIDLLRISLGLVFFGFGVLKFVPGLSPAESLATQTLGVMTFGLVPDQVGLIFVASLETVIGLLLLTGRWMRLALVLLAFELVGILSPLVLLPAEMFRDAGVVVTPTLEGQYVLKDVIVVAAGLVVAARTLGARMVVHSTQDRSRS
jgi:putative oxidoreductase